MAGLKLERKGPFCAIVTTGPRASTDSNTRAIRQKNTNTKERNWEGSSANAGLKEHGGLPVVSASIGLVAPVVGIVACKFLV